MTSQYPSAAGGSGEVIDLPAPGEQGTMPAIAVQGMIVKLKKITTTDEGKLQVVLETEGMDDAAIRGVQDMLTLQQTCMVQVSMLPLQRDLFDA